MDADFPESPALARWLDGLQGDEVRRFEPLAPWCSVRVGGPAEAFVRPATAAGLERALRFAAESGVPLAILGGGANTLIGDRGVPGLTLKLRADYFPEELERDGDGVRLTLNAGAATGRLVALMKQEGLVGAEFLAGVPGTIGGAAVMNAGTRQGECLSVVESLELATAEGLGWVHVASLQFGYRHTVLPLGSVVTRVRFRLRRGDVEASARLMEADLAARRRTQPWGQPSFGSVFTNPPGRYAGALIEQAGLKGHRIGNAQISTLHANWIVNLGQATAKDVTALMALAQQRVHERSGVTLRPEVKRLGLFL